MKHFARFALLVLTLLVTSFAVAAQKANGPPPFIQCTVVEHTDDLTTLVCAEAGIKGGIILDIPESGWPRSWSGHHDLRYVFIARRDVKGHLQAFARQTPDCAPADSCCWEQHQRNPTTYSEPSEVAMPTPITLRQKIVEELKLRLAGITIANGYQTDIGLNAGKPIERWPTQYQEDDLKAATRLGIFDLVNTMAQSFPCEKSIPNTLPVQVRIFHRRGTSPDELGVMIADVMQAVISDPATRERDAQLGGLAIDMKPTEEGFIVPKETFQIDGAAVRFEVEFYTEPFNAYE